MAKFVEGVAGVGYNNYLPLCVQSLLPTQKFVLLFSRMLVECNVSIFIRDTLRDSLWWWQYNFLARLVLLKSVHSLVIGWILDAALLKYIHHIYFYYFFKWQGPHLGSLGPFPPLHDLFGAPMGPTSFPRGPQCPQDTFLKELNHWGGAIEEEPLSIPNPYIWTYSLLHDSPPSQETLTENTTKWGRTLKNLDPGIKDPWSQFTL